MVERHLKGSGVRVDEDRGRWRWTRVWPFALLCVLGASRWLIEGVLPSSSSTLVSEAAGCAMAALLVFPIGLKRAGLRCVRNAGDKAPTGFALLAAMLLVGPALSVLLAGQFLNANNTTLAFALCPVVVAVVASAAGDAEHGDLTGLLWPGLAGVAGLLLLVPEPTYTGVRPWLALFALPAMVGFAAGIWAYRLRPERNSSRDAFRFELAAGLGCAAISFGLLAVLRWKAGGGAVFSFSAAALDGLMAVLTLLTLGRLGAVRWSSQFLFIPLLGLLEGVVFLKPFLDGRSYLAFGLLAVSAVYQWMARPPERHGSARQEEESPVPEA